MAARTTLRMKKQQQSRVFFGVIFYVYANVDNREKAKTNKADEFRGKKNMEIQSGSEKMKRSGNQVKTAINTIFCA